MTAMLYNKRVLSDVLITVCGMVFGCFFTVHLFRFYQQKLYSNPIRDINEVEKGNLNLQGLKAERDRLLNRLQEIDNILSINSINVSHTSMDPQKAISNNLNSLHSMNM